ncbi:hypothetical protein AAE478_004828 [Parahypoxylon ruwenzoriense]
MSSQRRGPWSQSEDCVLIQLVDEKGDHNWVSIAQRLHSRTPKQCRERYHQNLNPSLNHDPITPEEGALINKWVSEIGRRWAEIARRLGNRSDNAVKNWWNGSQNRRRRMARRNQSDPSGTAAVQVGYCSPSARESPPSGQVPYPSYREYGPPTSPSNSYHPHRAHHVHHAHHGHHGHHVHHAQPQPLGYNPGLSSPSILSPCSESLDALPSSRPRSVLAHSATLPAINSTKLTLLLPPLRTCEVDPLTRRTSYPTQNPHLTLPPITTLRNELRLPPIRDGRGGRGQLPTAPNSPQDPLPVSLPPRESQDTTRRDSLDLRWELMTRMSIKTLLL